MIMILGALKMKVAIKDAKFCSFISPRIWTCASKKYLKLKFRFFLQYLELLSLAQ